MGLLGHNGLLSKTIGALTGANSAKEANEQNIALQRETNQQSIELANSAHQREVQDLIKAGLNPVLSAGGSGAVTPALGTAQVQNTNPGGLINNANQAAQAYGSIMGGIQAMSGSQLQQAQTKQTQVQTELQPVLAKAEVAQKMAGAGSAKAQQAYTEAMTDVDKALKEVEYTQKTTKTKAMENAEKASNTWWGRNISPYLADIGQVFGGAGSGALAGAAVSQAATSAKKIKTPKRNKIGF